MPKDRHKLVPAAYLLLVKDEKILLLRRYNTGYEDGNYSLPAGHVEAQESAITALVREAHEEVGLAILPVSLRMVHVMHRKGIDGSERVDFFFVTNDWPGEPQNVESEKCDDLNWFPLSELPENTIPYIRFALKSWQKGVLYSEYGW